MDTTMRVSLETVMSVERVSNSTIFDTVIEIHHPQYQWTWSAFITERSTVEALHAALGVYLAGQPRVVVGKGGVSNVTG